MHINFVSLEIIRHHTGVSNKALNLKTRYPIYGKSCGDVFMDFIHRPKSKILKLKIKITTFRKLALLPSSGP
jgi:hypothetical protein